MKYSSLVLLIVLLSGCIAPGPNAPEGKALVKSAYRIIAVDGVTIAPVYDLLLDPGLHSIDVVYPTYSGDYHCHFSWHAGVEQRYEITDAVNVYPLTLYRWVRKNSLWAIRFDSTHPEHCERQDLQSG